MWIISCIFPYKCILLFKGMRDILYSMWIRNFMGKFGKGSCISYPCSLEGGGQKRIEIGNSTRISRHSILGCHQIYLNQRFSPIIKIGNHCLIGEYNHITACNRIIIGDGLLTGRFVTITDNSHGGLSIDESDIPPYERQLNSKGEVVIGDNVWIGDKVTILPNVHIEDNVIVAANSVVTKDLPSNCVAAGVPAKVIKVL